MMTTGTRGFAVLLMTTLAIIACGDAPTSTENRPHRVTDLMVTEVTSNQATLRWTEVSDGLGQPADYAVFYDSPIITDQTTPGATLEGTRVGGTATYAVRSLSAETQYQFEVVSFRGTDLENAVVGASSNVATITTDTNNGTTSHEPAGMTEFFHTDFSNGTAAGEADPQDFGANWIKTAKWTDETYTEIVADESSPTGSGYVLEKRWYEGEEANNGNGLTTLHNFSDEGGFLANQLYIRYVVKFSPNYDWIFPWGGMKFGFWGGDLTGVSPTQYYLANDPAQTEPPRPIVFADQTGSNDDVFFRSSEKPLDVDKWLTIEVHQVAQSALGAADGEIRLWVNGTLMIEGTGLVFLESGETHFNSTKLNGIQIFFIRGAVGETFRVDDWMRLGELYISGKQ